MRTWNPLLGANISWKAGFDSQLRFNSSQTFSNNISGGTQQRTTDKQITGTVSYSIRTGFRIPILFLKSFRLENQTTFSLNLDYHANKTESTDNNGSTAFAVRAAQTSYSISPRMSYTFSNTVQGQAYVQIQQQKNEVTEGISRLFEFGIQVNISIRG